MATTPNMDLLLPDPTITPGPTYASENNSAFDLVDSHDHTLGKGVPVPSNGININNDLPFNGFNALNLRSTQYQNQSSPLSLPSDLTNIYVANGNLYYNNQIGQQVQITAGATLNAASIGGIGGDYVTSGALVFYTSADRTYTFTSATNVPANLDSGSITIRPIAVSPDGITINAPNSLAVNYSMTLPGNLPSQTSFLTIDSSGNIDDSIPTSQIAPAGIIQMYGGITIPTGYLICDGSAVSRTTFAALFVAIATNYGVGDGSTTFNVPDLRGIFPRGVNAGSGNDPDASSRTATNGGNAGDNVGSTQTSALASHNHTISGFTVDTAVPTVVAFTDTGGSPASGSTGFAGGSTETRPINTYVNFIIKT